MDGTFAVLLRYLGDAKSLSRLRYLHSHILRHRLLGHGRGPGRKRRTGSTPPPFPYDNTYLANVLVQMYGKCGCCPEARAVFDAIPSRDSFSWNIMIAAYSQNGLHRDALLLYRLMESEGGGGGSVPPLPPYPDKFARLSALSSAASLGDLAEGRRILRCLGSGMPELDLPLQNAVLNLYGKCGCLREARTAFDGMCQRDIISWNAILAAYAHVGHAREALDLFSQMGLEGVKPNRVTFLCLVNAFDTPDSLEHARRLHQDIVTAGLDSDVAVKTAILNMYGRCGSIEDARVVFEEIRLRDMIAWSAMITAYARNGHAEEAMQVFRRMVSKGFKPDMVTFVSLLDACVSLASLEAGREVHDCIDGSDLESETPLANALINMYAKCGSLVKARSIFDQMNRRTVISWNVMFVAYAQNGCVKEAGELLWEMDNGEGLKLKPNRITLLCLLSACSHAGLQDDGWLYLVSMSDRFDVIPSQEHFVCFLDLLGRAGSLDEANDMASNMPVLSDDVARNTLLGFYRIHGVTEQVVEDVENVLEFNQRIG